MTDLGRLWIGGLLMISALIVALAGTSMTDLRYEQPGRAVTIEDEGVVRFPAEVEQRSLADRRVIVRVFAFLALLASVGMLLGGPRARMLLLIGVLVLAPATAVGAIIDRPTAPGDRPPGEVSRGPARPVTSSAAGVATIAGIWVYGAARRVPRLGMPEQPPEAAATDHS